MNNEFGVGKIDAKNPKIVCENYGFDSPEHVVGIKLPLVPIGCAHRRFHFDNHALTTRTTTTTTTKTTSEPLLLLRTTTDTTTCTLHTKLVIHIFISYGWREITRAHTHNHSGSCVLSPSLSTFSILYTLVRHKHISPPPTITSRPINI